MVRVRYLNLSLLLFCSSRQQIWLQIRMQTTKMISIISIISTVQVIVILMFVCFMKNQMVSQKVFEPIVHEYYYGCMYHSIVLKLAHLLAWRYSKEKKNVNSDHQIIWPLKWSFVQKLRRSIESYVASLIFIAIKVAFNTQPFFKCYIVLGPK